MRLRFASPMGLTGVMLLAATACASSLTTTPAPTASTTAPTTSAAASWTSAPLTSTSTPSTTSPVAAAAGIARRWLEAVEALVREVKPTPPEAARLYAYATTAYADALDAGGSETQAGHAVVTVVDAVRPTSAAAFASATSAAGLDAGVDAGSADVVAVV